MSAASPAASAAGRRTSRARSRGRAREGVAAWLLALPFCILFAIFSLWPVVQSAFMSFTDTKARDLRHPFGVDFVGLDNYIHALGDAQFQQAAFNTMYFVVVGVPATLAVALAAAVALDKGISRFRSVFRLGFYTPVVTSIVAVAVVWRFLLRPDGGLVNTMLGWVGIVGPNWLGDSRTAMPALVVMAVWRNFGTGMIIFLAGLQGVPWSLHEAAAIDGASPWQRFRHITVPTLRPTILFVAVTTTIGYLQFFEEPFVMTKGGPLDHTLSMSMLSYQQFGYGNYATASAMSYLIFLVIAVVTFVQFRLMRDNT